MRGRVLTARIVCLLLLVFSALPAAAQNLKRDAAEDGMLAWPQADMVRALELYVPRRMVELGVPGTSIAIVRDGQLVYEGAFGVSDAWSGAPLTHETLFEVSDLGQPVAAYGALLLAKAGHLPLDTPLAEAVPGGYPESGGLGTEVTPRELLSHTAGFGNNVALLGMGFGYVPERGFAHSRIGYTYLQHAMEMAAGGPFDPLMRALALGPLNMENSYYKLPPAELSRMARGYIPLAQPVLFFMVPFALLAVFFTLASWVVGRFVFDRPKFYPSDAIFPVIAALMLSVAVLWPLAGAGRMPFVLMVCAAYAAALGVFTYLLFFLAGIFGFLGPKDGILSRGQEQSSLRVLVGCFIIAAGLSGFVLKQQIPVPRMPAEQTHAGTSLRANAGDMGLFISGFLAAAELGPEWRARMTEAAVPVSGGISWGLGIGIRENGERPTYWERGSNPGFESLMVIDPERRSGVAVLTNSSHGKALAQEVAGQVLGLQPGWDLPNGERPF